MTSMLLTLTSCKRTLSLLDEYLDHKLSPSEMTGVRLHLAICHACEEKFAFQESFVASLRENLQTVVTLEEAHGPDAWLHGETSQGGA